LQSRYLSLLAREIGTDQPAMSQQVRLDDARSWLVLSTSYAHHISNNMTQQPTADTAKDGAANAVGCVVPPISL
jgi:hypothetical protein